MTVAASDRARRTAAAKVRALHDAGWYLPGDLVDSLGLTHRQLDYWSTTGLLEFRRVNGRGELVDDAGAGRGLTRVYAAAERNTLDVALQLVNATMEPGGAFTQARKGPGVHRLGPSVLLVIQRPRRL